MMTKFLKVYIFNTDIYMEGVKNLDFMKYVKDSKVHNHVENK